MQISRRDLFRSTAAVGGVAALGGLGLGPGAGLAAAAVAGSPVVAQTTRDAIVLRGTAAPGGWRPLVAGTGEQHLVRTGLGALAQDGRETRREAILGFVQLSDVHVCDSQSPMRYETTDAVVSSSAYRPQEILTAHIAESMVREINAVGTGPVTGTALKLALQTGDNSDNSQYNEIRWNIGVLDGDIVRPDSGDLTKYEGVMDGNASSWNVYFWHPEGTPEGLAVDTPTSTYGFPTIPGLLDAARAPFQAEGLAMPWYTAMGNHDPLVQGNFPHSAGFETQAIGTHKGARIVTADPDRRLLSKKEWVGEHFVTTSEPAGHGFSATNKAKGTAYYTFDEGIVRFIVLDTTNPNGSQYGSLDQTQFAWLQKLLTASKDRLVVLGSHHTVDTMRKKNSPLAGKKDRIFGTPLRKELLKHENVVLWVNGHTHTNNIWAHSPAKDRTKRNGSGFWEVNTASHIDWPQQSRLLEIVNNTDGTLSIFTTMLDHGAPLEFNGDLTDPMQLAALGRELAANDWQEQHTDRRGARDARNVELVVRTPSFLR